jgi:hypothetical protein
MRAQEIHFVSWKEVPILILYKLIAIVMVPIFWTNLQMVEFLLTCQLGFEKMVHYAKRED